MVGFGIMEEGCKGNKEIALLRENGQRSDASEKKIPQEKGKRRNLTVGEWRIQSSSKGAS